jgi:hypothetical protein
MGRYALAVAYRIAAQALRLGRTLGENGCGRWPKMSEFAGLIDLERSSDIWTRGRLGMRKSFVRSIIGLVAVVAFSAAAMAQGSGPAPGSKDSLYNGNRLKRDPAPGGPAPVHDVSGSWAGNLTPERLEIPSLTPLGQKLFSLNKPETEVGTGHSNDPMNTCDPLGIPRNTVFETRGLAFGTMPDRVIVLHQYQRVWRYVWMDGKHELPKKIDTKDGVPSRWYGYSVGHWDGDYKFVIETNGTDERTWLDNQAHPHSGELSAEERYTRVNHDSLKMEIRIDDAKAYTKPWLAAKADFVWLPKQEFEEQLCIPSDAAEYFSIIASPAGAPSKKAEH